MSQTELKTFEIDAMVALDEIADLVSPLFSSSNFAQNSPRESIGYGSVDSEDYGLAFQSSPDQCSPQYSNRLTPSPLEERPFEPNNYNHAFHYQPYPQMNQYFFPPNFTAPAPLDYQFYPPTQVLNSGLQDYLQDQITYTEPTPEISLSSIGKAKSCLKQRRASRSKCPCIQCCHARINCIPSPSSHACMVEGCNKTYTRPAHLRAHLKAHEQDKSPKCEICKKTIMSADLFIAHMYEHGKAMRL